MGGSSMAVVAAFPFLLWGYDEVITKTGTGLLQKHLKAVGAVANFETKVVPLVRLGGILLAGLLANRTGRRFSLAFGAVAYTVGVLVFTFASDFATYKAGRSLMGIGLGCGVLVSPIYIAEVAPARHRGRLGYFPQVLLCLGNIVGYVVQYVYSVGQTKRTWQLMMGLPAISSAAFLAAVVGWLAESPSYLALIIRNVDKAREVLLDRLRTPPAEVDERVNQWNEAKDNSPTSSVTYRMWGDIFSESTLPTLVFLAALHVFREMSGDSVLFSNVKATLLNNDVGSASQLSCLIAFLMLAGTKLLASVVTMLAVDCCGRIRPLGIGISVTLVGTSVLGMSALLHGRGKMSKDTAFVWYLIGGIVLEIGVGAGLGGIPWLYGPEAFKLPARAMGITLALTAGQVMALILDMGWSAYSSTELAGSLMLVSAALMPFAIALSCHFVEDMRKVALVDVEVQQQQQQQQQLRVEV
ncbi:Probable polyol transporter 6 [Linum grandiflorum]